MNAFKKSLIVAASFASLSLFNSAVADMVYKPLEQPVEPVKPDLKIESVNENLLKNILANSIRGKRLKKATKSSMQMNKTLV